MTYASVSTVLPDEVFELDAAADDWRAALKIAGERLTAGGFATPDYTDEMIAAVEKLGPYIVVAPGIAFAHSRPSPAVLHTGMSWVRLSPPVDFGSAKNDPVWLVIGLAATDEQAHIGVMSQIAGALSDSDRLERLRTASSPEEIRTILAPTDSPQEEGKR
ncbi:MAG TPA: PTS sugar transporter subunit IIA [Lacisediminihabitans sp.]|uniref:PTS sugar transporter subunit IIA n=1 Tax=Lacisediminihabitans sp. TaxID=2787631 RepID=UPI002EDAEE42